MKRTLSARMGASVVALMVGFAGPTFGEVTFQWAVVGNAGNVADPLNSGSVPGIGSVSYFYLIAKHEVTNDQYAEFLNAIAAADPNELYNANMGSNGRGGITRNGSSSSYTYNVRPNMGNKPVNYVSFFDAMRFVNWLHNGQPSGSQNAGTTEGGVYAISDGWSETRVPGARFFIPAENEWYKAAYHQPSNDAGDSDDYWLYPTASNSVPTLGTANAVGDISNPGANVVNYKSGAVWPGFLNGNVTTVGSAGPLSESFYGTSDQGGNLWEWNEQVVDGSSRVIRGGSWNSGNEADLQSSFRPGNPPSTEVVDVGFRVAGFSSQAPVPSVSVWGLSAMALSILTAGTILHTKRASQLA